MARRWWATAAAVVAAVALAAGCGAEDGVSAGPPKEVPVALVPATLDLGGDANQLTLTEHQPARAQFAQAGVQSMVADGRLWEIRQGATLIGTLQVSTLKPKVDLRKRSKRRGLAELVLPGAFTEIKVLDVEVASAADRQLTTYMWFGNQLFQVLQLKSPTLKPEAVLRKLLQHQLPTNELTIPGIEDEEDERS